MKNGLKKYGSLLLLALFLFPMAERELHAFQHHNDEHCTSIQKHFHKKEHHCVICDCVVSTSSDIPENQNQLTVFVQITDRNISVIVSNKKTSPKFTFSLRGPPPVC